MGIKFDEKAKKDFFLNSRYYRKLNQVSCSMTLNEFLANLSETFTKTSPNSGFTSLEDFVAKFLEKAEQQVEPQKAWEKIHFKRRREIMTLNSIYKDDKQQKMFLILDEKPTEDIRNIIQELERSNFSVSIYEKIFLLKAQRDYVNTMLKVYREKPQMSNSALVKVRALEEKQTAIEAELERETTNFGLLFKKPIATYYY